MTLTWMETGMLFVFLIGLTAPAMVQRGDK